MVVGKYDLESLIRPTDSGRLLPRITALRRITPVAEGVHSIRETEETAMKQSKTIINNIIVIAMALILVLFTIYY